MYTKPRIKSVLQVQRKDLLSTNWQIPACQLVLTDTYRLHLQDGAQLWKHMP